jgi:hypothetical protein
MNIIAHVVILQTQLDCQLDLSKIEEKKIIFGSVLKGYFYKFSGALFA